MERNNTEEQVYIFVLVGGAGKVVQLTTREEGHVRLTKISVPPVIPVKYSILWDMTYRQSAIIIWT